MTIIIHIDFIKKQIQFFLIVTSCYTNKHILYANIKILNKRTTTDILPFFI